MNANVNITFTLGNWQATCLKDTDFWLDAGTWFHMIPKKIWQRKAVTDSENRLPIGVNCLLLEGHGRKIIYDCGMGGRYSRLSEKMYRLDRSRTIMNALAKANVRPEEIDTVILSHLHYDHTGWCVTPCAESENGVRLTFPNARHLVQEAEWQGALSANELERGSYETGDFLPLEKAGLVDLLRGNHEPAPGIKLELTGAHSPGHQIMTVESGGGTLLCPCEIIPDRLHTRLCWVMDYDAVPGEVLEVKRELLRKAAANGWTVFLSHEPGNPFGTLRRGTDEQDYFFAADESPEAKS